MVSFQCAKCGDVIKKPKVASHAVSCRTAGFSCVDCMENFDNESVKKHTACMTEAHRYQGQWRQATNALVKKSQPAVDSEEEEEKAKGIVKPPNQAPQKRRRALPADFTDSSDDDDDASPKRKPAPVATQKTPAAATSAAPPLSSSSVSVESFEIDADSKRFLDVLANICAVDGGPTHNYPEGAISVKAAADELVERYKKRVAKQFERVIAKTVTRSSSGLTIDASTGLLSLRK